MITSIELTSGHKSLVPFKWNDLPKLAVIAGVNGSGKSQLLHGIYDTAVGGGANFKMLPKRPVQSRVKLVPATWAPGEIVANNSGTKQLQEDRFRSFISAIRGGVKPNNVYVPIQKEMEEKLGCELAALKDQEIFDHLPGDFVIRLGDYFNNQYVADLFYDCISQIDRFKRLHWREFDKAWTDDEVDNYVEKSIGYKLPWKAINEIFSKYGIAYRIVAPTSDLPYNPSFQPVDSEHAPVRFAQLSDGEKIILSLIFWAYNSHLNSHADMFLFDELDAHLNPSMSRMMMEIIRSKLVAEFGIQVIMTTHNPSTIAYAEDCEVHWMERGRPIRTSSRAEIIPKLADGIITVTNDEAALKFSVELGDDNAPALCVEGIWDKVILIKAWKRIYKDELMPFRIFDMFGASFIVTLFQQGEVFRNYPGKRFIGLIDFDDAYVMANGKLTKNWSKQEENNAVVFLHKERNAKISTLPLPSFRSDYVTQDRNICRFEMELMFRDELIREFCTPESFPGGHALLRFNDGMKERFAATVIDKFDDQALIRFYLFLSTSKNYSHDEATYFFRVITN